MKGFELLVNGCQIRGGIRTGITGVSITYKHNACRILFNSLSDAGMFSQTWYSSNLTLGDKVIISYQEIDNPSQPERNLDYNDKELLNKLELENYYRIRDELMKEGVITD